jgi:hypothetical protein
VRGGGCFTFAFGCVRGFTVVVGGIAGALSLKKSRACFVVCSMVSHGDVVKITSCVSAECILAVNFLFLLS